MFNEHNNRVLSSIASVCGQAGRVKPWTESDEVFRAAGQLLECGRHNIVSGLTWSYLRSPAQRVALGGVYVEQLSAVV